METTLVINGTQVLREKMLCVEERDGAREVTLQTFVVNAHPVGGEDAKYVARAFTCQGVTHTRVVDASRAMHKNFAQKGM